MLYQQAGGKNRANNHKRGRSLIHTFAPHFRVVVEGCICQCCQPMNDSCSEKATDDLFDDIALSCSFVLVAHWTPN